jgi:hypothetical protein
MRVHIKTRAAALISALLLVFVLSAFVSASALAAPPLTQLQRTHPNFNAHIVAFGTSPGRAARALGGPLRGRGALIGRYVLAPGGAPLTGTTPWIVGGILAALLVGGAAAVATASRRAQVEPAGVTELESPGSRSRPEESESSRRKAA